MRENLGSCELVVAGTDADADADDAFVEKKNTFCREKENETD